MSKPKFTYFDTGGRAVACRICLFKAFGKDGWEDDRLKDYATQQSMKAEGKFPLGSVPVLTLDGGEQICQSEAICRYAAKVAGLYPADALAALEVDMVATSFMEVLGKCPQDPDNEKKKALREEYAAGWMLRAMTFLEKTYSKTDSAFLQNTLTMADLHLLMVVDMILLGQFDYVPATYMDQFPKLLAASTAVKAHDVVTAYLASYPN